MSDIWLSQTVSSSFLEAFRRCDPANEKNETKHFMAFPAVVCAAFSAEIGLKTILKRQGINATGHDLYKLFKKLSPEQQYQIFEETKMEMKEFVSHLAHSRLAFVKWRYIHEEIGESFINLNFIGVFAQAIETISTAANKTA